MTMNYNHDHETNETVVQEPQRNTVTSSSNKRRRGEDGMIFDVGTTTETAILVQSYQNNNKTTLSSGASILAAPTLQLSGHTGSIYSLQYSPNGATLCSTSFDKTCLLWQHRPMMFDEFDDDEYDHITNTTSATVTTTTTTTAATYKNFHVLQGHSNAVLDCTWFPNDNHTIVTASADHTIMIWDIASQQRLKKYTHTKSHHHTNIVNAITAINEYLFVSVSDDKSIILTDRRCKYPTATYMTNYPVLAVVVGRDGMSSSTSASEYQIYTSGIDPTIHVWDVRQQGSGSTKQTTTTTTKSMAQIHGHTDTVTGLSMHPYGTHLLSNSMDQSIMEWDVRPFVAPKQQQRQQQQFYANHTTSHREDDPRHVRTYVGHTHSTEKGLLKCNYNADGTLISAGSTDTYVHVWDVLSGQELYTLSGHKGCVNTVAFHPTETTILASGSSDQQIFVGELTA